MEEKRKHVVYERWRRMDDVFLPRREPPFCVRVRARLNVRTKRTQTFRGAFSIILLCAISFVQTGATSSFFDDRERRNDNTFAASHLDFDVSVDRSEVSLEGGGESVPLLFSITPAPLGLETVYRAVVEETGGNPSFCSAIMISALPPFSYEGALAVFSSGTTSMPGLWPISTSFATSSPDVSSGDTCAVDFVFRGWFSEMSEGESYGDEERLSVLFTASSSEIILANVLPDEIELGEVRALSSRAPGEVSEGTEEGESNEEESNEPPWEENSTRVPGVPNLGGEQGTSTEPSLDVPDVSGIPDVVSKVATSTDVGSTTPALPETPDAPEGEEMNAEDADAADSYEEKADKEEIVVEEVMVSESSVTEDVIEEVKGDDPPAVSDSSSQNNEPPADPVPAKEEGPPAEEIVLPEE